jgi:hypothetical protein
MSESSTMVNRPVVVSVGVIALAILGSALYNTHWLATGKECNMAKLVTFKDVTEVEVHQFATEASTLGIKPGEWPDEMPTILGNRLDFAIHHAECRDGDLLWVEYRQEFGCITLKVFND